MVVGPSERRRIADNAFPLKQIEHRGAVVYESFSLCAIQSVANVVREVGARLLSAIAAPGRLLMRVDRDPDHTCRIGGGPAEQGLLLGHDDIEPLQVSS